MDIAWSCSPCLIYTDIVCKLGSEYLCTYILIWYNLVIWLNIQYKRAKRRKTAKGKVKDTFLYYNGKSFRSWLQNYFHPTCSLSMWSCHFSLWEENLDWPCDLFWPTEDSSGNFKLKLETASVSVFLNGILLVT